MANWYKEKSIPSFKLVNLNEVREFSIWKEWNKRSESVKDSEGNEMKFPIKTGVLTDIKGQIRQVSDLDAMPKKTFTELYPMLSKNWRFIREIEVNGETYNYGFGISSNTKIKELIETAKSMGQDPLNMIFTQEYNAAASPANKYTVKMRGGAIAPSSPSPKIVIPQHQYEKTMMSQKEQEIIDAIKSINGKDADESKFVTIMVANGVTSERAKELFIGYKL